MKKIISIVALSLGFSTLAFADAAMKPGKCSFSNLERVKTHSAEHLKLPANGKTVKQVCRKEWPDEFTKAELACIDASLQDDHEYKTSAEVLAALGVK